MSRFNCLLFSALLLLKSLLASSVAVAEPSDAPRPLKNLESDPSLTMVVTNIPPWGWEDNEGHPKGVHARLLKQLGVEWQRGYQLRVMPYARIVREVDTGAADVSVLFDAPHSHAVADRLVELPEVGVILVRANGVKLEDFVGQKDARVGRLRLGHYGYGALPFSRDQYVVLNSIAQGVSMLQRGRLQVLITTVPAYKHALQQLQMDSLIGFSALTVGKIRGAVFLSKRSDADREAVRRAALKAVEMYRSELQSLGSLRDAVKAPTMPAANGSGLLIPLS